VDTALTYEPPTEGGEGLPFKIKEAKLTSKNPKGNVTFDVFSTDGGVLANDQTSASIELPADGLYAIEVGTGANSADYTLSVNAGAVSDYRVRGIAQTSFQPAVSRNCLNRHAFPSRSDQTWTKGTSSCFPVCFAVPR